MTFVASPSIVGTYTGTFYVADVKLVKLNGALLNVIRTNITDINVTDAATPSPSPPVPSLLPTKAYGTEIPRKQYVNGVDFEVVNPVTKNVAGSIDLVAAWEAGNKTYTIKRIEGGRIAAGQQVRVSFDMLGGFVGMIGDGAHCNSYGDPGYSHAMSAVIDYAVKEFNVTKAFFGFDELHGYNRDSRSRRTGHSNAKVLGDAINSLQRAFAAAQPGARAMVWSDMLNPWHNGARPQYEQYNGGISGSTWRASLLLDKEIIHVPWMYNTNPMKVPVVNCSTPDLGKDCVDPPVQCNNVRCFLEESPGFYSSVGADWVAAGGVSVNNFDAWSKAQAGHPNALGMMTTQWVSSTILGPDISGIPNVGEYSWNLHQTQRGGGCAV